jgi:hypothetical protein
VHRPSLARQHLVVHRLLDERVPEGVAGLVLLRVGHAEVSLDGRAQAGVELVAIHARDGRQQLLVDPAT